MVNSSGAPAIAEAGASGPLASSADCGMDSLPSVRIQPTGVARSHKESSAKSAARTKRVLQKPLKPPKEQRLAKRCSFLCGKGAEDSDEEDPEVLMRWAHGDGSGTADWYCERTWCSVAHRHESKADFQKNLKRDVKLLDEFKSARDQFIEDRKKGKKYYARKRDGIQRITVKQRTSHKVKLLPPEEPFYPFDQYVAKFGDPKAPEIGTGSTGSGRSMA